MLLLADMGADGGRHLSCATLLDLAERLASLEDGQEEDVYQTAVFDAGKAAGFENMRAWFTGLYEVVLGQSEGPRMGPFIAVLGPDRVAGLIRKALDKDG